MNLERASLRRNLLEFLCDTRPLLVERLKQTNQVAHKGRTPYHLEDSVWTHTLLTLQTTLEDNNSSLLDILCSLVHDFGKPDTATLLRRQDGTPRISFPNHGARGTQLATDFLLDYKKEFCTISLNDIAKIVFCVSGHLDFYQIANLTNAKRFCSNDKDLLTHMFRLFYADITGSIMDTTTEVYKTNMLYLSELEREITHWKEHPKVSEDLSEKQVIHFFCGAPYSGIGGVLPEVPCPVVHIATLCDEKKASATRRRPAGWNKKGSSNNSADLTEEIIDALKTIDGAERAVSGVLSSRHSRKNLAHRILEAFPEAKLSCHYYLTRFAKDEEMRNIEKNPELQLLSRRLWTQPLPNLLHESYFSDIEIQVLPEEDLSMLAFSLH